MTTGYNVQPNKAVVGASAFAHESGIHQHGVLSQPRDLRDHGPARDRPRGQPLVLGKHCGRHAFIDALEQDRASRSTREHLNRAFARFKDLADRKIQITDQDLAAIVGRGARRGRGGRSRARVAPGRRRHAPARRAPRSGCGAATS